MNNRKLSKNWSLNSHKFVKILPKCKTIKQSCCKMQAHHLNQRPKAMRQALMQISTLRKVKYVLLTS